MLGIEALDLSVRTYNVLMRAGITTVEEICSRTELDLARVRNMGGRSINELKEKLAALDLRLAEVKE